MNQRHIAYAGAALLLLLLLGMRYGCRGGVNAPAGDTREARLAQIDAMRQRQRSGDVAQLAELADHSDADVSRAAIYALGAFESPQAATALGELLRSAERPEIRAAAAAAIGQSNREIDTLIDVLNNDSDPQVRAGAAHGLASYTTPDHREALPAFVAALEDEDAGVRKVAIRGIYQASKKRFLYEPDQPPAAQRPRIAFIKQRLKELKLLD